ncbi:MAG: hypothetical protein Q8M29_04470 [Bacteroidota bacterium]|nr:hypothetical protein [Bacteroidota bacterium]
MKKNISVIVVSFILSLICFQLKSQDLIVRAKGDTIIAKVMEVGTNTVSYKKSSMPDGPTFVVDKKEIIFIKYSNGEVQDFFDSEPPFNQPSNNPIKTTNSSADSIAKINADQQVPEVKNKIEMLDNKFTINGQKATRKDVNRYLEKSTNPAIKLVLKSTKATASAQKIMKITSYPTTIAGGITSLFTVLGGYQLVQRGRATPQTFINMGLSLVGTAAFPITAKILKRKSDKMYDKVIDMYNITN